MKRIIVLAMLFGFATDPALAQSGSKTPAASVATAPVPVYPADKALALRTLEYQIETRVNQYNSDRADILQYQQKITDLQNDMKSLQSSFKDDSDQVQALKLKAIADVQGKYDFDLTTLTYTSKKAAESSKVPAKKP